MVVTNQIQPHEGDIIIPPEVKPYSKRNVHSKEKVEQKNNAPKKSLTIQLSWKEQC